MNNQEPIRPNPDELLVKANEIGRGKLKIFSVPVQVLENVCHAARSAKA